MTMRPTIKEVDNQDKSDHTYYNNQTKVDAFHNCEKLNLSFNNIPKTKHQKI